MSGPDLLKDLFLSMVPGSANSSRDELFGSSSSLFGHSTTPSSSSAPPLPSSSFPSNQPASASSSSSNANQNHNAAAVSASVSAAAAAELNSQGANSQMMTNHNIGANQMQASSPVPIPNAEHGAGGFSPFNSSSSLFGSSGTLVTAPVNPSSVGSPSSSGLPPPLRLLKKDHYYHNQGSSGSLLMPSAFSSSLTALFPPSPVRSNSGQLLQNGVVSGNQPIVGSHGDGGYLHQSMLEHFDYTPVLPQNDPLLSSSHMMHAPPNPTPNRVTHIPDVMIQVTRTPSQLNMLPGTLNPRSSSVFSRSVSNTDDGSEDSDDEMLSENSIGFSSSNGSAKQQEFQFHQYDSKNLAHMPQLINGMSQQQLYAQPPYLQSFQPAATAPVQTQYLLPTTETMNKMNKQSTGLVLQTAEQKVGRRASAGSKNSDGKLSPKAQAQSYQGKMYLVDPVEENDKKIRRLLKNRLAAKESRRKKKEFMSDLEIRMNALEEQNQELLNILARYKALYGELP